MPRLSIIIPHRNDDQRLEGTLVSVLENRPINCEILVAHDGSYRDMYNLSGEVVFVETNAGSSVVRKINEAALVSCSPIVNIVFDGVSVSDRWCESPLEYFAEPQVAAVSPVIEFQDGSHGIFAGLVVDPTGQSRLVDTHRTHQDDLSNHCSGPVLACGFYRRKILLSLNGWLEAVESSVVDVDFALALQSLGLICELDGCSRVSAPQGLVESTLSSRAVRQLATMAVAYQQVSSGLVSAACGGLSQLLHAKFLPAGWKNAVAWGLGTLDRRIASQIVDRLQAAADRLANRGEYPNSALTTRMVESFALQKPNSRRRELRNAA